MDISKCGGDQRADVRGGGVMAMSKFLMVIVVTGVAFLLATPWAEAQQLQMGKGTTQKLGAEGDQFYKSRRQIQIIDERPIVHDFRTAPEAPSTIELPPAPAGFSGGANVSGGDALPAGGIPVGGRNQGFRSASTQLLPNASFGRNSNMGSYHAPAKAVPGSFTSGVMGRMASKTVSGKATGLTPAAGRAAGPRTASYGDVYGAGSGSSSGGSSMREEHNVRGTLLRSK